MNKEYMKKYLNDEIKIEKWQSITTFFLVVVISGFIGFVYEFIFYYFNGGMKEFYMQGGNFLPWINIYAVGAVMIILLTSKFKKNPFLVFFISFFSTGILEYFSGLAIYKLLNGTRYWDYNTEILNFGNIDGFVCLRSVAFFGVSGLFLIYMLLPFIINLSEKLGKKKLMIIATILFTIVMLDEAYNLVGGKIFKLPDAVSVYKSIGFKYVE